MRTLASLRDSALMLRLLKSNDPAVLQLAALVEPAAEKAAHLLNTVVRDMPLYTLHNERHILNILAWMERLLPEEGIANLSPLECAVAILAAYTHDLGMTLTGQERLALPTDPDYLRHRDRFLEERHLIDSLRSKNDHHRANLIENHLITDFLRTTHADQTAARMRARLGEIALILTYRNADFRLQLELTAISHNQPVEWLRLTFEKENLHWRDDVGPDPVNYPFIGILLRLADIMDFDASRTPPILFRHIGLEGELATRFETISHGEWQKHLAITATPWPPNTNILTYRAADCPHPAIEKSIRSFVAAIQNEVNQAASELLIVAANEDDHARCLITLPREVKPDVTPARLNGAPAYTYHDWNFTLDQQEIINLLMGESLYGDPSLCIRELLQNSLDAVELRDLRLQCKAKGGLPAEPVEPLLAVEELAVRLSWGEQDGKPFIRVEDNGVGMTKETIQRYFTQIGRSFYRSPDFRAEQAEMRRLGLIATPISTFGIGVLSCFMIADRISVRTHPGNVSDARPALDLEISGPGSLFWTRPGSRSTQGTEVTIWLRKELKGKPVRLEHDREQCFERLRRVFDYSDEIVEETDSLDPGFTAASHVVWPKYPVHIAPPAGPAWTIIIASMWTTWLPSTSSGFTGK